LRRPRLPGYEVTAASDGQEGISLFSPETFDVVITDVKMPGLSGIEVLRRIKKQAPEIPALVVTAFGNVETAVEAMKSGAYDFIGKPFQRNHLLLSVERAFERRLLPAHPQTCPVLPARKVRDPPRRLPTAAIGLLRTGSGAVAG
jgi:DNA-binding NtrC family response regulator